MLIVEIVAPRVRPPAKRKALPKPKPLPKMPEHPDARQRRKRPRPFNEPKPLDQC